MMGIWSEQAAGWWRTRTLSARSSAAACSPWHGASAGWVGTPHLFVRFTGGGMLQWHVVNLRLMHPTPSLSRCMCGAGEVLGNITADRGPWVILMCAWPAGWVAGPVVLALFAWITYFCSALLIDAYRYPTPDGQTRNYKYSDAVSRYMGADPPDLAGCMLKRNEHCVLQKSLVAGQLERLWLSFACTLSQNAMTASHV